ncbi:SDR family oxidoreductase [Vibrio litoralis]|uniref:SDR family oxidoreductase n=1 Tax=Vibrio litoralis TaxID=335972 RepID=UPI00040A86F6|nr:SDR family oxidoreductase [Vibrio litoralis]
MSTLSPNQNKLKILITGGNGDLAKGLYHDLSDSYDISLPDKNELNVSSIESVSSYFRNNEFDIIVNAAGTLYSSNFLDSEPEKWIRDIEVNLIGTYLISRFGIEKNKNVVILNISSTAAYASYSDWTSYCAAKAGVMKLSSGMLKEGFNIITLCPGAIDTKIRNGLKINNPNVMTLSEGIQPIKDSIKGKYKSGDIVFYRKNELEIRSDFE